MYCRISSTSLQDYLEHRMSPEQEREYQEHLDSCSDCRAELTAWQDFWKRLDGLAPAEQTPDLAPAIMGALQRPADLPRLLVFLFVSACAGSTLGFFTWTKGSFGESHNVLSACLWALAGVACVFSILSLVGRERRREDADSVQEESTHASHI
jgi:hypothetical protein